MGGRTRSGRRAAYRRLRGRGSCPVACRAAVATRRLHGSRFRFARRRQTIPSSVAGASRSAPMASRSAPSTRPPRPGARRSRPREGVSRRRRCRRRRRSRRSPWAGGAQRRSMPAGAGARDRVCRRAGLAAVGLERGGSGSTSRGRARVSPACWPGAVALEPPRSSPPGAQARRGRRRPRTGRPPRQARPSGTWRAAGVRAGRSGSGLRRAGRTQAPRARWRASAFRTAPRDTPSRRAIAFCDRPALRASTMRASRSETFARRTSPDRRPSSACASDASSARGARPEIRVVPAQPARGVVGAQGPQPAQDEEIAFGPARQGVTPPHRHSSSSRWGSWCAVGGGAARIRSPSWNALLRTAG